MEFEIQELKNSWYHCKDVLKEKAHTELAKAFLEDFKVQLTQFHRKVKHTEKKHLQQVSTNLIDTFYIFWKKKGELSHMITRLELGQNIHTQMAKIDTAVHAILAEYA